MMFHIYCGGIFFLLTAEVFLLTHEDVNGEKLTVKKWWIFGADFHGLRRVFTVYKGHKR